MWFYCLQDRFENIAQHISNGIDFCDHMGNFFKERSNIENEYAAKLKYTLRNDLVGTTK